MKARAVIFHSLEDAFAAAKAARNVGCSIILLSPPGAAAYLGPLWFKSLTRELRETFPDVSIELVIDCGANPGDAMGLLRHGFKRIVFTGTTRVRSKLSQMAERCGAEMIARRPRALDLRWERDGERACRNWLATP